jgi:hypothetical protein
MSGFVRSKPEPRLPGSGPFRILLARQNGDDPAVRQAVADACFRVGDIQKILG